MSVRRVDDAIVMDEGVMDDVCSGAGIVLWRRPPLQVAGRCTHALCIALSIDPSSRQYCGVLTTRLHVPAC